AGGADLAAAEREGVTVYAPVPGDGVKNPKQIPKREFAWQAAERTYVCPQGHRLVFEESWRGERGGGGGGGGGRPGPARRRARRLPAGALPGVPAAGAVHADAGPGAGGDAAGARGADRDAAGADGDGGGAGAVPPAEADGGVGQRGREAAPAAAAVQRPGAG